MSEPTTNAINRGEAAPIKPAIRLDWIDLAKGFSCLLVVVGHTISSDSTLYRYIFSFHMPLFFILAGFTFRPKPMRPLIKSSAKRLLVPYTIVFLLWHVMNALKSGPISTQALSSLAKTFIFASGINLDAPQVLAVGMSWFLMVLFVSRIIFNGAATITQRAKHPLASLGLICSISLAAGLVLGGKLKLYLPFSFDIALIAVFFMFIGYAAKECKVDKRVDHVWIAAIISAGIWIIAASNSSLEFATRAYHSIILMLIAAIAGTLSFCLFAMIIAKAQSKAISLLIKKPLLFYGRQGMAIYCIHALDWWIAWNSLPFLVGLPFSNGLASIIRILYCTGFVLLLKTA